MDVKILVHGSGHRAESWNDTISYLTDKETILCPDLSDILHGNQAAYANLYASFIKYCSNVEGKFHLCGISLGGILALNYALDFPQRVKTLVLIGTPHKIPKVMFGIQNVIFRFLPQSVFQTMAFDKQNTFALGNSMKNLDFTGRLGNILSPTLIICGKRDRANIRSAYYLSQHIKDAELKIMEDTGHIVNEEAPEALANILTEYYLRNS